MNLTELNILVPLFLSILWLTFVFCNNLMYNFLILLMITLFLPFAFVKEMKLFWPCSLLLILLSTGLMVVFAYVVSLYKMSYKLMVNPYTILFLSVITCSLSDSINYSINKSCFIQSMTPQGSVVLSTILISLLLFFVVIFIRLIYSKGGGFRKKF